LLCLLLIRLAAPPVRGAEPDAAQLHWLGERIFRSECASRPECLTAWNAGEEFPSLGIGHFIWYSAGQQAPFTESFPDLLRFMQDRGVAIPDWIEDVEYEQPWPDRDQFLAAVDQPRLTELREFLAAHMALQTAFIVARFELARARILNAAAAGERAILAERFDAIAAAAPPYGWYALIDYVHFKGEGTAPAERYQGHGWGLLQVLQEMPRDGTEPLQDFVRTARAVLAQRVERAPPERNEHVWLAGWQARVDGYLPTAL
jgi:hypothetical protein